MKNLKLANGCIKLPENLQNDCLAGFFVQEPPGSTLCGGLIFCQEPLVSIKN
jgi:hypothetical protein